MTMGIYKIENVVNGRIYIGSSKDVIRDIIIEILRKEFDKK